MSLTLALLLASTTAEPTECRRALEAAWPELVERLNDPVSITLIPLGTPDSKPDLPGITVPKSVHRAIADAVRLRHLCEADAEASAYLRGYEASQRLRIEDHAGAYRVLAAQPIDLRSPTATATAVRLMLAGAGLGEAEYRNATTIVRSAHRAAATAHGLIDAGSAQSGLGWIDSYRTGDQPERVLFAWPNAGMPLMLVIGDTPNTATGKGAGIMGCNAKALAQRQPSSAMSDADALSYAFEMFDAARLKSADSRLSGPWGGIGPDCPALDDIFFAFGPVTQLIGSEFSAPATLTGKQVAQMLNGSAAQQARAVDAVIARPELVDPSGHIQVIGMLWERGDRLQATFLYYVCQVRFIPWAKLGSPSGEGALFSAIRATVGPEINGWIGSDPLLNRQVLERALSYERKIPLHPDRPDGVDEKTWLRTVEEVRAGAAKEWLGQMPVTPKALKDWAKQRSKNGLPNGPVEHPGAPLPDHWQ